MFNLSILFSSIFWGCSDSAQETPKKESPTKVTPTPKQEGKKVPVEDTSKVYFVHPPTGATVYSPVTVVFGVDGKEIAPAGEKIGDPKYGHHHLIIDGDFVETGKGVPMDPKHRHYGKGQTQAQIALSEGKHKLTMQFANGAHISYGKGLSADLNINVVPTPEKLGVDFVKPQDGAKVSEEIALEFAVFGMEIKPAGTPLTEQTSGHHHLIIDGGPIAAGKPVPMNDTHIHFGKGQTTHTLKLAKGSHSLTLQFADGAHISYGPTMSKTISVTVE